jgi:ABC-type branched-subunit amino acid transport system substrate-binding protein
LAATPVTAALTLSLTGRFHRQGAEAAEGVRLWAEESGVRLILTDDQGSKDTAVQAYAKWVKDGVELVIGPYASGLVRAVIPVVRSARRLLWNHGGSADDLAQPGIASLPAPATTYFHRIVDEAAARYATHVIIARGTGPYARAVADGAMTHAANHELSAQTIELSEVDRADLGGAALLIVGHFEQDVAVIRQLSNPRGALALLAAVAAGIPAFGEELGEEANGVFGPVQWWPSAHAPEIGPSGADFATRFRQRTGHKPSYPAAQAAAACYLAHAAHRRGMAIETIPPWKTSTLLGTFALNHDWQQVGHHISTIQWQDNHMVPIALPDEASQVTF